MSDERNNDGGENRWWPEHFAEVLLVTGVMGAATGDVLIYLDFGLTAVLVKIVSAVIALLAWWIGRPGK